MRSPPPLLIAIHEHLTTDANEASNNFSRIFYDHLNKCIVLISRKKGYHNEWNELMTSASTKVKSSVIKNTGSRKENNWKGEFQARKKSSELFKPFLSHLFWQNFGIYFWNIVLIHHVFLSILSIFWHAWYCPYFTGKWSYCPCLVGYGRWGISKWLQTRLNITTSFKGII